VGLVELPFRIKFSLSGKLVTNFQPSPSGKTINNYEKNFHSNPVLIHCILFARCKYYCLSEERFKYAIFLEKSELENAADLFSYVQHLNLVMI
jgi:hypothetical protein